MENDKVTRETVLVKVSESIAGSGENVRNAVVEELAKREVSRRISAVVSGFDQLAEAKKAFAKIKPDQQSFDGDGKMVVELFSKPKMEELKKAQSLVAKIEKALDLACGEKPDYSLIFNLKGTGDSGATSTTAG